MRVVGEVPCWDRSLGGSISGGLYVPTWWAKREVWKLWRGGNVFDGCSIFVKGWTIALISLI